MTSTTDRTEAGRALMTRMYDSAVRGINVYFQETRGLHTAPRL